MKRSTLSLATTCFCLLLAGCAAPQSLFDWKARCDGDSVRQLYARGVHVYVSVPSKDGSGSRLWRLKGVEADLYDDTRRLVGRQTHEAAWEAADTSTVTGEVREQKPATSCGAVPWRLYEAQSSSSSGIFANVVHVERTYTYGGNAPLSWKGDQGDGIEARVPFTATYRFHSRGEAPGEPPSAAWGNGLSATHAAATMAGVYGREKLQRKPSASR